MAVFTLCDESDRLDAEPRRKDDVLRRGRTPALHVAEHGGARLDPRAFSDLLSDPAADPAEPAGRSDIRLLLVELLTALRECALGYDRDAEAAPGLFPAFYVVRDIVEVRGKGLMLGIEFADPGDLAPRPDLSLGVMEAAKARGLLIGRGGLHGNVIRMAPALSVTSEEATEGYRLFSAAVRDAVG